jgi:hypothetical protein
VLHHNDPSPTLGDQNSQGTVRREGQRLQHIDCQIITAMVNAWLDAHPDLIEQAAQIIARYSLRHTAICMRIIPSQGHVNIFNLAKNAGTPVDQIERFYARNLPLSKEMAINRQTFGSNDTNPRLTVRSKS